MTENPPRYYEFGEFKIDSRRRNLFKGNEEIAISAKNFDLLLFLIQNEGRILTHNEILDNVWEGTFVEQSNLKKGISNIRQVLGETSNSSNYIKTVPRKGYSFVASVRPYSDELPATETQIQTTEIVIEEEIIEFSEQQFQTKSTPQLVGKTSTKPKSYVIQFLIVGIILALPAVFIWYFIKDTKESQFSTLKLESLKPQRLSTNGNVVELALSSDGRFFVYGISETNENQSLWLRRLGSMNAIQLVPTSKISINSIKISPENDFVYYTVTENFNDILYQIPILGGTPKKILENIQSTISFSPDGKKFAFARNKNEPGRNLVVYDLEKLSESNVMEVLGDLHLLIEPKWSPDGKSFAFIASEKTENGRVWMLNIVDVDSKSQRNLVKPQRGKIYSLEWIQDGSGILFTSDLNETRHSQIFRVSYPKGETQRLTNDLYNYFSLCISNDGKSILTLQEEQNSDIWSVSTNDFSKSEQVTRNINLPGRFSVLPDGSFLAEILENNLQSLSVINADGTNPRLLFQQPSINRFSSITPDGKSIIFLSRRSGSDQIWQTDISGNNPQKLTEENTFLAASRLSTDGQTLYFERYNGSFWQIAKMPKNGGAVEIVVNERANSFDISPDGKLIGFGFFDESAKKWKIGVKNISDNLSNKFFDIPNGSFIKFTPDSKAIVFNTSNVVREGGNLWFQPLDGSAAKPLIELKDEKVFEANYSPDGKKLYYTRGKTNSSAVLLNNEAVK